MWALWGENLDDACEVFSLLAIRWCRQHRHAMFRGKDILRIMAVMQVHEWVRIEPDLAEDLYQFLSRRLHIPLVRSAFTLYQSLLDSAEDMMVDHWENAPARFQCMFRMGRDLKTTYREGRFRLGKFYCKPGGERIRAPVE